ncbi:MAG: hypothetical protein ACREUF_17740, partial [Solimonas sp.]
MAVKEQLEMDLLAAQKDKLLAEIGVLRRTTPMTEAIKIIGSMILGIGGAIAAVAGFQLAEVKAEKFKLEASAAEKARDAAAKDVESLEETRIKLSGEVSDLGQSVAKAKADYASISDKLSSALQQLAQQDPRGSPLLRDLQQEVNAADIELRTSSAEPEVSASTASMDVLVEALFAPTAAVRGKAYEGLMARYAQSSELVPKLLSHAEENLSNANGIYNT